MLVVGTVVVVVDVLLQVVEVELEVVPYRVVEVDPLCSVVVVQ